jgi:hypothetical protein
MSGKGIEYIGTMRLKAVEDSQELQEDEAAQYPCHSHIYIHTAESETYPSATSLLSKSRLNAKLLHAFFRIKCHNSL